MRVLITGYSGFAGGHLADHLLATTDWHLWGTVFGVREDLAAGAERVHELPANLLDPVAVDDVLDAAQPDLVFHLAGQSSVRDAWTIPWQTFEINVRGQVNLLQGLLTHGRPCRVVVVISNEVYGTPAPEALPLDETAPLAPVNPYAVSKAAQDMLAGLYARAYEQLEVIRVRPFTHIGPRQSDQFVTASFARQVAEIEAGQHEPVVRVGNLDAERDFTDVRDMVRAYRLVAERGRDGEAYNLGRGDAVSIRAVLEFFVARAAVPIAVVPDPARMRPTDVPRTLCDAAKARRELGWAPEIPIERTLGDILEYWRGRVAAAAHRKG